MQLMQLMQLRIDLTIRPRSFMLSLRKLTKYSYWRGSAGGDLRRARVADHLGYAEVGSGPGFLFVQHAGTQTVTEEKGMGMNRLLLVGLAALTGLVGLVLASGNSGDESGPSPSAVALARGSPPGPYSETEFEISDDAVDMVLSAEHAGRSMRLWGDGRLEIQAGEDESYTRRLERPRIYEIFRAAVDHGLAEFDVQLLMLEIGLVAWRTPCRTERVVATLRFSAYDRHGAGGGVERAGICPDEFPQIVQSKALADLRAVLDYEIGEARREGSIELPAPIYKDATFTFSSDPTQLIFSFRVSTEGDGPSMRLYGDGRLELQRFDRWGAVVASHDRNLPFAEATELVRLAVDHGFAEWDRDSLKFRSNTVLISHTVVAFGELHLESYRRGEYARDGLDRSFRFEKVYYDLKYSADVLQIQGLKAMQQVLDDYFESAGAEVGI